MKIDRPRILYLAPCRPDERTYGLQLRTKNIRNALGEIGDVQTIVVGFGDRAPLREGGERGGNECYDFIEYSEMPERGMAGKLSYWLNPRLANPHGQVIKNGARQKLLNVLDEYDLVWVHHLRTANVFERWHWPGTTLDVDDIPSKFYRTLASSSRSYGGRLKAMMQSLAWQRRERLLGERFTLLTVCSEEDKQCLPANLPVRVVPNGFERPATEPQRTPATPPRIGFIGPLTYDPNLAGVQWFVRECWPIVKTGFPGARLRLAGNGSDGPLKPAGPDIDGLGWIADAAAEIATWSAMIVPLRVGGGTRLKVAEGFSRKCPIISTTLGAYGYNVANGQELVVADGVQDFARGCLKMLADAGFGKAMAERAWRKFNLNWTWDAVRPRVHEAARECLRLTRQMKLNS